MVGSIVAPHSRHFVGEHLWMFCLLVVLYIYIRANTIGAKNKGKDIETTVLNNLSGVQMRVNY